jgi:hypothetical protein
MIRIIYFSIVIGLFIIIMYEHFEKFTVIEENEKLEIKNKSNNIFDRHPIQNSIISDINIKYNKAYYYEYNNTIYLNKLNKTFINDECYIKNIIFKDWETKYSIEISSIYQNIYNYLYNTINNSTYLKIDNSENIQIVHDILNRYKYSEDKKIIILDLDLILYRENKSHGKHVNLEIAYSLRSIKVFNIKIKGIINESDLYIDKIENNHKININFTEIDNEE